MSCKWQKCYLILSRKGVYWLLYLVPLVVVQCSRQDCILVLYTLSWYPQYLHTDAVTRTFKLLSPAFKVMQFLIKPTKKNKSCIQKTPWGLEENLSQKSSTHLLLASHRFRRSLAVLTSLWQCIWDYHYKTLTPLEAWCGVVCP